MGRKNYSFAELPEHAIRELKGLESRLYEELGEEITLIAYEKEANENESTACRADLKGE
ncbi:hypothetical protein [Paenibacillus sp.]|uniref:hypothetical protein n=1 Tax=Paenibacillus sp. TaxID=58172 RepID=UPI002D497F12|nr:hypothetical protein [Paenibacillus sp.]HZG58532.1 hypothetical protein [Paenibacillus sp.]